MHEWKQPRFLKLKSEPPQHLISPDITSLLEGTGLNIFSQTIVDLASTIQSDITDGYRQLVAIDRGVGGVGFHNVNRREGDFLTGNYRVEFRPIFRPIQYAFERVTDGDLVWNARYIVQWACAHVEDAIKYRFGLSENDNSSLGILLTRRPQIEGQLEPQLLDWIRKLNRLVYRRSKHSVEEQRIDAHRFAPADAIAVYLMCRWSGVRLLEPTGIFGDWKQRN